MFLHSGVVRPGYLQFGLIAVKDVDVLVVVEVGDGVGEVLVGKNPDDRFRIQDWLFRGFCVVKYDPWNPDPRSPPIPLNHHHHLIFILFTANHNIPQSLFAAEENLGNLQVSYITKISLIGLNWSTHRANCHYRDHVDGQLNICAEI